jgi:hypothetical protein
VDAIRRARADAEDYARSLGLRESRILRVSERTVQYGNSEDVERMFATLYGLTGTPPDEIGTTAQIAVDFALAR